MYIPSISTAPLRLYNLPQTSGNPANPPDQPTDQRYNEAKTAVREAIKKQWASMQAAKSAEGQAKVERLTAKFDSGQKLTSAELSYIVTHAPSQAERILRLTAERERMERMMRAAPTKMDMLLYVSLAMNSIEQQATRNPQEAAVRAKHLQDAMQKYQNTEHYKNKPNDYLDFNKKKNTASYQAAAVLPPDTVTTGVMRAAAQLAYVKSKGQLMNPLTIAGQNK